jgi:hypothetical protein
VILGSTDGTMFSNASLMSAGDMAALGLSGTHYEATLSGQRFWLKQASLTLVPLAPVLVPEPSTSLALLSGLGLLLRRRRR